jgi:pyrimidine operon attenuation protein/uracil phosphoribosyltransferase
MNLKLVEQVCDRDGLLQILDQLVDLIAADCQEPQLLACIGILDGGAPLADYLAERLSQHFGQKIPVAYVDITLYRDDMVDTQAEPYTRPVEIPFALRGRTIILVDDVLFTGRTVRAALSAILAKGRPRCIRLAVAVSRGFHELPIRADFVGIHLETSRNQAVRVRTKSSPGNQESGIYVFEKRSD